MTQRNDDREPLSPTDEAFVRNVADLYAAPPMTSFERTRFDARLEERVRDGAKRQRAWFAAGAAAAVALSLLVWRAAVEMPAADDVAQVAVVEDETATGDDEWILAMATESVSEADDALPADYQAISDLLLGD